MSKGLKLLLGAATLWPLLYAGIFMGFWASMVLGTLSGRPPAPAGPTTGGIGLLFGLHCLTMVLIVGLVAFYVVDVFRNPRVRPDQRVVWAVGLLLGNLIAMPVYWARYIWGEARPVTSAT